MTSKSLCGASCRFWKTLFTFFTSAAAGRPGVMTEVQRAFGDAVGEFLLLLQWLGDPVAGEEAEQGELEHVGRPWVLHVRRSREEEKIPLQ